MDLLQFQHRLIFILSSSVSFFIYLFSKTLNAPPPPLICLFYLSEIPADERLLGVNIRSVTSGSSVITSTSASAATTAQSLSLVS